MEQEPTATPLSLAAHVTAYFGAERERERESSAERAPPGPSSAVGDSRRPPPSTQQRRKQRHPSPSSASQAHASPHDRATADDAHGSAATSPHPKANGSAPFASSAPNGTTAGESFPFRPHISHISRVLAECRQSRENAGLARSGGGTGGLVGAGLGLGVSASSGSVSLSVYERLYRQGTEAHPQQSYLRPDPPSPKAVTYGDGLRQRQANKRGGPLTGQALPVRGGVRGGPGNAPVVVKRSAVTSSSGQGARGHVQTAGLGGRGCGVDELVQQQERRREAAAEMVMRGRTGNSRQPQQQQQFASSAQAQAVLPFSFSGDRQPTLSLSFSSLSGSMRKKRNEKEKAHLSGREGNGFVQHKGKGRRGDRRPNRAQEARDDIRMCLSAAFALCTATSTPTGPQRERETDKGGDVAAEAETGKGTDSLRQNPPATLNSNGLLTGHGLTTPHDGGSADGAGPRSGTSSSSSHLLPTTLVGLCFQKLGLFPGGRARSRAETGREREVMPSGPFSNLICSEGGRGSEDRRAGEGIGGGAEEDFDGEGGEGGTKTQPRWTEAGLLLVDENSSPAQGVGEGGMDPEGAKLLDRESAEKELFVCRKIVETLDKEGRGTVTFEQMYTLLLFLFGVPPPLPLPSHGGEAPWEKEKEEVNGPPSGSDGDAPGVSLSVPVSREEYEALAVCMREVAFVSELAPGGGKGKAKENPLLGRWHWPGGGGRAQERAPDPLGRDREGRGGMGGRVTSSSLSVPFSPAAFSPPLRERGRKDLRETETEREGEGPPRSLSAHRHLLASSAREKFGRPAARVPPSDSSPSVPVPVPVPASAAIPRVLPSAASLLHRQHQTDTQAGKQMEKHRRTGGGQVHRILPAPGRERERERERGLLQVDEGETGPPFPSVTSPKLASRPISPSPSPSPHRQALRQQARNPHSPSPPQTHSKSLQPAPLAAPLRPLSPSPSDNPPPPRSSRLRERLLGAPHTTASPVRVREEGGGGSGVSVEIGIGVEGRKIRGVEESRSPPAPVGDPLSGIHRVDVERAEDADRPAHSNLAGAPLGSPPPVPGSSSFSAAAVRVTVRTSSPSRQEQPPPTSSGSVCLRMRTHAGGMHEVEGEAEAAGIPAATFLDSEPTLRDQPGDTQQVQTQRQSHFPVSPSPPTLAERGRSALGARGGKDKEAGGETEAEARRRRERERMARAMNLPSVLAAKARDVEEKLEQARMEKAEAEMEECTFRPSLTEASRRIAAASPPLSVRHPGAAVASSSFACRLMMEGGGGAAGGECMPTPTFGERERERARRAVLAGTGRGPSAEALSKERRSLTTASAAAVAVSAQAEEKEKAKTSEGGQTQQIAALNGMPRWQALYLQGLAMKEYGQKQAEEVQRAREQEEMSRCTFRPKTNPRPDGDAGRFSLSVLPHGQREEGQGHQQQLAQGAHTPGDFPRVSSFRSARLVNGRPGPAPQEAISTGARRPFAALTPRETETPPRGRDGAPLPVPVPAVPATSFKEAGPPPSTAPVAPQRYATLSGTGGRVNFRSHSSLQPMHQQQQQRQQRESSQLAGGRLRLLGGSLTERGSLREREGLDAEQPERRSTTPPPMTPRGYEATISRLRRAQVQREQIRRAIEERAAPPSPPPCGALRAGGSVAGSLTAREMERGGLLESPPGRGGRDGQNLRVFGDSGGVRGGRGGGAQPLQSRGRSVSARRPFSFVGPGGRYVKRPEEAFAGLDEDKRRHLGLGQADRGKLVLYVDVHVGGGKTGRIGVHEFDDSRMLVRNFAKTFGKALGPLAQQKLLEQLNAHIGAREKERERERRGSKSARSGASAERSAGRRGREGGRGKGRRGLLSDGGDFHDRGRRGETARGHRGAAGGEGEREEERETGEEWADALERREGDEEEEEKEERIPPLCPPSRSQQKEKKKGGRMPNLQEGANGNANDSRGSLSSFSASSPFAPVASSASPSVPPPLAHSACVNRDNLPLPLHTASLVSVECLEATAGTGTAAMRSSSTDDRHRGPYRPVSHSHQPPPVAHPQAQGGNLGEVASAHRLYKEFQRKREEREERQAAAAAGKGKERTSAERETREREMKSQEKEREGTSQPGPPLFPLRGSAKLPTAPPPVSAASPRLGGQGGGMEGAVASSRQSSSTQAQLEREREKKEPPLLFSTNSIPSPVTSASRSPSGQQPQPHEEGRGEPGALPDFGAKPPFSFSFGPPAHAASSSASAAASASGGASSRVSPSPLPSAPFLLDQPGGAEAVSLSASKQGGISVFGKERGEEEDAGGARGLSVRPPRERDKSTKKGGETRANLKAQETEKEEDKEGLSVGRDNSHSPGRDRAEGDRERGGDRLVVGSRHLGSGGGGLQWGQQKGGRGGGRGRGGIVRPCDVWDMKSEELESVEF
uniref:EF-hand domain-containing protein n=1 Tax=Chromera velia CCMP2878 TaxID=1169474 RepID=A0A0G4F200_9ALVE|eukprot:Cvel_14682.t1-p1 / transcript=Cvel_14682.t1 / gene=Cvel_14682 / organism=Chromera_velia_CCMP2878 / gene_product=hypothetical protein / transcript_product=hypothetical protein / location=Cvel_scaffold1053:24181-36415(-) / protein_length=2382 / sequence_SO=supercontig / SO=protein_coding / is_pseudo=false